MVRSRCGYSLSAASLAISLSADIYQRQKGYLWKRWKEWYYRNAGKNYNQPRLNAIQNKIQSYTNDRLKRSLVSLDLNFWFVKEIRL